ncbi:unnamed protein product [Nippostrongylus brasiliensis]|uniref:POT1PC domain-containing protein n=1 Tax=Nippostrongylus brasiliensis TaxID=27835 RepID=A0A158R0T5_NIPBR|nr:unnamed protein product [Nippostrongylus brasiliensis]
MKRSVTANISPFGNHRHAQGNPSKTNKEKNTRKPLKRFRFDDRSNPGVNQVITASEIPMQRREFFNWPAQVLGVYSAKFGVPVVIVRCWDGTLPKFPCYRKMYCAEDRSNLSKVRDIPKKVHSVIANYCIDVCCFGNWMEDAITFEIGDVVLFEDIRNYTCRSNMISALTMHSGGKDRNRSMTVLDHSDPIHYYISRQCADTLSKCAGSEVLLLNMVSDVEVSPITADQLTCHSTPKKSNEQPHDIDQSERLVDDEQDEAAVDDISLPSTPNLSLIRRASNEENGVRQIEAVPDPKEQHQIRSSQVEDDDVDSFIDETHNQLRKEDLAKLKYSFDLTSEMEDILKINVGDDVWFGSAVDADMDIVQASEYITNAIVYTAVCMNCKHEFVVQRGSRNWCIKCYRASYEWSVQLWVDPHLLKEAVMHRKRLSNVYAKVHGANRDDGSLSLLVFDGKFVDRD